MSTEPRFVLYFLMSDLAQGLMKSDTSTTAIPMISQKQIGICLICIPPRKEQQAIADHLDQETQRLDQLKANLNQQINVLSDYKKSLIYECVTGKKRLIKAG